MTFSRIHHVTGAEERKWRYGEGEKGVPGGHALSLYNIVSFEKFLARKNPLSKLQLHRIPRAINFIPREISFYHSFVKFVYRNIFLIETHYFPECVFSGKYIVYSTYSSLLILGEYRNPLCASQRSDTF